MLQIANSEKKHVYQVYHFNCTSFFFVSWAISVQQDGVKVLKTHGETEHLLGSRPACPNVTKCCSHHHAVVNLALVSGRSLLHETVRTSWSMSACRLSIIQTPSSKCSGSCGALSWMVKILRANGYYHIYAWQWHVLRSAATESQAKMPPKPEKKTQWKGSNHRSQMPNRLPTCSFWPDKRSWNLQDTCTQVRFPLLLSLLIMKFASSSRIEPYKI